MLKNIGKNIFILCFGGVLYALLELLWRQRTHWTMVITGGVCFLSLYKIYTRYPAISLFKKCLIGSLVITVIEFTVGCFVNLKMKWGVWDYSSVPMNLLGQVCLKYSVLWGFLCIPISFFCRKMDFFISKFI